MRVLDHVANTHITKMSRHHSVLYGFICSFFLEIECKEQYTKSFIHTRLHTNVHVLI